MAAEKASVRLVLCTCPDEETAMRVAETVVTARQAACVNVLPGIRSVYRWEGKLERDSEVLLLIKTTGAAVADLERTILGAHPYELPEIVAVPVEAGLEAYLDWVRTETAK